MEILPCPMCGSTKSCRCYVPPEKKDRFTLIHSIAGFELIFNALEKHIREGSTHWSIEGFVDKPEGKKQPSDCEFFDVEWVDQGSSYPCDDCFEGHIYFPVPDGRYLKIYFAV